MRNAPHLTEEEERCMRALAYIEMEPKLVEAVCTLPVEQQQMVEQMLVVAYWIGHHQANVERLAELDRLTEEWKAKQK